MGSCPTNTISVKVHGPKRLGCHAGHQEARAADVTPDVNLRNPLKAGDKACEEYTLALSPEVKYQGINGSTKRIYVL